MQVGDDPTQQGSDADPHDEEQQQVEDRPPLVPGDLLVHVVIVRSVTSRIVAPRCSALFETAMGRCRVQWTDQGISAVALPPVSAGGHGPVEPPPAVREAIVAMVALLD